MADGRAELEGLLSELMITGAGAPANLSGPDLKVFRQHGRMFRLLGLLPAAADEGLEDAWKTLVALLFDVRGVLAGAVRVRPGCGTALVHPGADRATTLGHLPRWFAQDEASLTVRMELDLSGVPTTSRVSVAELWTTLLPLALWLLRQLDETSTCAPLRAGTRPGRHRVVVGLAGAGGSGKTWLSCVLVRILGALVALPSALTGVSGLGASAALFAAVSMDGYHYPNSRLDATPCPAALLPGGPARAGGGVDTAAAGEGGGAESLAGPASPSGETLRSIKGAVATFDAAAFAADLAALRGAAAPVSLPVYDRSRHDPSPRALAVPPSCRLILVEGLYLLHGAGAEAAGTETLPPAGSAADPADASDPCPPPAPARTRALWAAVHASLDAAVLVDVPAALCRARIVRRKAAAGVRASDAESRYDAVDRPVHSAVSARWRHADAVLRYAGDGGLASIGVRAEAPGGVERAPTWPRPVGTEGGGVGDAGAGAARPAPRGRLCFLGLNPALQRTVVMPSAADLGGTGAGPWRRGGVHRAVRCVVGVGGKGQAAAAAAARVTGARGTVSVVQPLGGHEGAALAEAQRETPGAPPSALRPLTWALTAPGARTRTCITLVDASGAGPASEAVTEIIEPSEPLSGDDVSGIADLALAAIDGRAESGRAESGRAPPALLGLGLMGTVPPGCEGVYADAAAAAAALRLPGGSTLGGLTDGSPPVLLDGYKGEGVLRALRGGGVHALKVNADELLALAAEAGAGAGDGDSGGGDGAGAGASGSDSGGDGGGIAAAAQALPADGPGRLEAVERCATACHAAFGVRIVAVTDGPSDALLFDFRRAAALSGGLLEAGLARQRDENNGSNDDDGDDDGLCRSDGAPLRPLTPTSGGRRPSAAVAALAARHRLAVSSRSPGSPRSAPASPGSRRATRPAPEDGPVAGRAGGALVATHSFRLPALPYLPCLAALQSPIGAGDACAGVFLRMLADGVPPADAFAHGLAAASASCEHLENARFDPEDVAERVLPSVSMTTWLEAGVGAQSLAGSL